MGAEDNSPRLFHRFLDSSKTKDGPDQFTAPSQAGRPRGLYAGTHPEDGTGACASTRKRFRGILSSFSSPQTIRGVENDPGSSLPELSHQKKEIPYGDNSFGDPLYYARRSHGYLRLKGRLPARPYIRTPQEILKGRSISSRRTNSPPVHRPSLWDHLSTFCFHEGGFGHGGGIKASKYPDNSLPGRLAGDGTLSRTAQESPVNNSLPASGARLANKLGEVMHHSSHQGEVSRICSRFSVDGTLSVSRETGEITGGCLSFVQTASDNYQDSHEGPRVDDFNDRSHTLGSLASKTPSMGDSRPGGSQSTLTEQEMRVEPQGPTFPQVVEILHSGNVNDRTGLDPPDNRCLPVRMGCSPGRGPGAGHLELSSEVNVFQPQRATRYSLSANSLCPSAPGEGSKDQVRQHDFGVLHSQTGGHTIPASPRRSRKDLGVGRSKSLPPDGGAHSWVPQCGSRSTKSGYGNTRRMVPGPEGLQADHPQVGHARSGPYGHEIQRQGAEVLLPLSGGQPSGSGRSVHPMEVQAGLHFPSSFSHSQRIEKTQAGPGDGNSHLTVLAKEVMVPPTLTDESRAILETSSTTQPDYTGIPGLPRPPSIQSDSLEVDEPLLRARGLSEAVRKTLSRSRAESTNRTYTRIKRVFVSWCVGRGVNEEDPPLTGILEFLQEGLDKGLSPATLRVQVAALSAALDRSLAGESLIRRFLKAATRIKPPVFGPVPQWDLSVVLNGLCGHPFEPLEHVQLKFLSLKVVFLLAITSAKRVSELQAFSSEEPYTTFLPDKVLLRFLPTFLPKVPTRTNINQVVALPSFYPEPSSEEERRLHTLDVPRCLRLYLERTSEFRRSEILFLQYSGKNRGCGASKATLSRWIKEAIRSSLVAQDREIPPSLRAHSTRAVATSWAERSLIPLEQICAVASWGSQSTFIKHYRVDSRFSEGLTLGQSVLNAAR